jgi:hypothetical protein
MFVQYEVWGTIDGRDELIDCVATLKEAELIAEDHMWECEEVYILKDEDGQDPVEVKRLTGL